MRFSVIFEATVVTMLCILSSSRFFTTASWVGNYSTRSNYVSKTFRQFFLTKNRFSGTKSAIRRYAAATPSSSLSSGNDTELVTSSASSVPKKRDPRTLGSAKVPFTWNQLRNIVENDQLDEMSVSFSRQLYSCDFL